MKKIPTALEFMEGNTIEEMMIAFAKMHVELALEEVIKHGKTSNGTSIILKDSILNSYPLENIK